MVLDLTLAEAAGQLGAGATSSTELTRVALQRVEALNGRLNAFLRVDAAGALEAAAQSDARRGRGEARGPLDGVPLGIKDNLLTGGLETTAGSRILQGFVPPVDATAVRKLREAGAVLLGKLNLDEFAMGSSNESSAYGPARNPWDTTRTPGGSSGGSAAAVAARLCFGALGSDTGGSIRQPAALTGTVGLKPTWGRVSRFGLVAYASSLDQVGPMARTVTDCALLLQALAGPDAQDATAADLAVPDYTAALERGAAGLRVGVPAEYFGPGMDPEVEAAVRGALRAYEQLGATLVEVSLPHTKYALATYYLLATAEASSNLARFDGVRFGHRARDVKGLRELYARSRSEGFGPEVKRRIMLGTFALSAGHYDAYYLKAQKVRTLIRRDFEAAFRQVDVVLSPTSPVPAFPLGQQTDPLQSYLLDVFTLPCNLAGLPGLSLPCGFTRARLPVGMQLVGRWWDEAGLLAAARAYERAHDFSRAAPPLEA
ncbi:MAG: Asp-tRNA(Asn)/Glu-tRNA(Gln) amidotransferase subunit GatA [Deltaproteobacteria bacterium]|nr:Asp-tRNA(Asn)/Glu-tRNA(Gln) amidotransferase subunit GatA [Deltaproteobacteria bacterium]